MPVGAGDVDGGALAAVVGGEVVVGCVVVGDVGVFGAVPVVETAVLVLVEVLVPVEVLVLVEVLVPVELVELVVVASVGVACVAESTVPVIVPASSVAAAGAAIAAAQDRPAPNATLEASTETRRLDGTSGWPGPSLPESQPAIAPDGASHAAGAGSASVLRSVVASSYVTSGRSTSRRGNLKDAVHMSAGGRLDPRAEPPRRWSTVPDGLCDVTRAPSRTRISGAVGGRIAPRSSAASSILATRPSSL